ncbi:MAG: nitrilase-related carbon-nitrogen hydrolase [Bacteroidota bacterium]
MPHHVRIALCYDAKALQRPDVRKRLLSVDVLVMPELVDGGYARLKRSYQPHTSRSPLLHSFRALSRECSLVVIAGSVLYHARENHNSSFIFSHGRVLSRYDKIHLFKPTGDHRYFLPGKGRKSFALPSSSGAVRCGVIICYDLRFPELSRGLAVDGVSILFVPSRWPAKRDDAWMTLLKARAIENQIFVVGCNAIGKEGGHSYIFDPAGKMVFTTRANSPRASQLHVTTLRLNELQKAKRLHHNLKEARLLTKRLRMRGSK